MTTRAGCALLAAALLAAGCAPRSRRAHVAATYAGSFACARCHAAEAAAWRGSDHDRAMQPAADSTVLGDFRDATFVHAGVTSRFFRRERRFLVHTDGPDGVLRDYEILYTFGVRPLQQYLVEFGNGRLQALGIAWDSRPKEEGGQRWFHMYAGERVDHTDELHWTRWSQNWNLQCAACHSTNLHKNYVPATDRYRTTWAELNVACEACHGPGSRHVTWAERGRRSDGQGDRGLVVSLASAGDRAWTRDSLGTRRPVDPRASTPEVEMCARCHSRRTRMFDDDPPGSPLMTAHLPALLEAGLYRADGQIEGEVYEYGSFGQSRMYQAGVACSDCHDPHSLRLRVPGNGTCLQCHSAARYDTTSHHFHPAGTEAANCVSCHMPARTYMVVDPRRDHGFRIPRPDLTERIGTPNACNDCHANRPARWAAERIRAWYGHDPGGYQRFAGVLHALRSGAAGAETLAIAVVADHDQPAIARATAAASLGEWSGGPPRGALLAALSDPDPMVRAAALRSLEALAIDERWALAAPRFADSVRVVRALAAGALASWPADRVPEVMRTPFERANTEYVAGETENADQPFARVNLGNYFGARGDAARAEREYHAAIAIDSGWTPAYANLADLLRAAGRDAEGGTVLRAGLERQPDAAALHHALGLLLVRRRDYDAGLAELRRAVELSPDDARFSYVYAVGLADRGRRGQALKVVERALRRRPGDRALTELHGQLTGQAGR